MTKCWTVRYFQMASKTKSSPQSALATRSATEIWLVGHPLSSIEYHSQLPVKGVALCRIYYEMKINKATLSIACGTVADEVMSFWVKANIPTTAQPHVVTKLKALHQQHIQVSKHKKRQSVTQAGKEDDFTRGMNQLLDIAHADWEVRTRIPEDRLFLIDQRGPRQMSMTTEDMVYKQAAASYQKRKQESERRYLRHKEESTSTAAPVDVVLADDSSEDDSPSESSYEPPRPLNITPKRRLLSDPNQPLPKRCILDDPLFNAALDRTRTSTRQAMMIVAPALAVAGVDVSRLTLSRTSLTEARKASRETLAATVRHNFKPTVPLVCHFDGKLLPHLDGTKRDCLPIVVSGLDIEKLLGIPMLPAGTGVMMGQKVAEFVRDWAGVEEHLAGLCFDTTASNTGIHTGAIAVVQHLLHRRLLFLACRHHMLEICAAAVFDAFFISKGPEIELFGRLKSKWNFIDKSSFDPLDSDVAGEGCLDPSEKAWLASRQADVISIMRQHLDDVQPREDYREFARLTLQLLGEDVEAGFSSPGAYHRARWMAKGIYCLKIFGFRRQLVLSKHELSSLRRICLFVVTIYATFWFAAPLSTAAPANDLLMLQLIERFIYVDKKIANVAEKKMRLHLWYLSEDLAALSLFGDDVSDEVKEAIVSALQKEALPKDLRRLAPHQIKQFEHVSISDFVTRRSLNLFECLRLPREFLDAAVDTWTERADYNAARKTVRALKVVNDCAERAVKLATDFNEVLTKSDQQRQLLYQVVEYHRNIIPTSPTKKELIKTINKWYHSDCH